MMAGTDKPAGKIQDGIEIDDARCCQARDDAELPADQPRYRGTVESLLFDGANSAVLLREATSRIEMRIALPQTGRFADLRVGEGVAFGFDPQRAVCFAAAPP